MERCSATEDLQAYENEQARLDALPEVTEKEILDRGAEMLRDVDNLPDYLLNFIEETEEGDLEALGYAASVGCYKVVGKMVIRHLTNLARKDAIKELNGD